MKLVNLLKRIDIVDSNLKAQANKAVNQLLTMRNWIIGYYIVEYEQKGEDRAKYGDKLLETIALKLNKKGFSYTNLNLFKQFYLTFPEILQTLSVEFKTAIQKPSIGNEEINLPILQTVSEEFKVETKEDFQSALSLKKSDFSKEKILLAHKIVTKLSFSHIVMLLPMQDEIRRAFYAIEAIKGT